MNNGWIKLHRQLRDNPIYTNSKAVHCWIECLLRANHNGKGMYFQRQKTELKQGQFCLGRDEFGKSIGMSGSTAWYWLLQFEVDRMVDIKKTTQGSIITILKWKEYQIVDSEVNNKKTANKQQINTNKNEKNEKNEKKNIISYSMESLELAKLLYKLIKDNNPDWYVKPNWSVWAKDIDKIIRLDGRTYEQVQLIIEWVQADSFWRQNVLSPSKLREKFNDLVVRAKQTKNKSVVII